MYEWRDLCWLSKQADPGAILSWAVKGGYCRRLKETLDYEMPLLFKHVRSEGGQDAGVTFTFLEDRGLGEEGYRIRKENGRYTVEAASEKGLLYGMYGLHRLLLTGWDGRRCESIPGQSLRMINHWDNFDGTIERGYAGRSIFYENNSFRGDFHIIRQYARLLASIGINSLSINNVNVHRPETFFLEEPALEEIAKIADVLRKYGIRLFLSVNFAAPVTAGKLKTADPLSPEVQAWWEKTAAAIYEKIPDFGGFVVKADSEGEPGPSAYGRGHDDGANVLARAIKPLGGIIIWRCFVYNCAQNWWDRGVDRAKAAYGIFKEADGGFEDNVVLQIKNGPIDFQVREPVSPLFGALKKTNQMAEFQITQEYTGHQKDICYLVPIWKEALDFETAEGSASKMAAVIRENSPCKERSGIAAVGNVGMDDNWTGNKLAQANLYGFGRLAWDNESTSDGLAKEWVRLSFDLRKEDADKIVSILSTSRSAYEKYTCPLGVGFMCRPGIHYGVSVDGYEYDRWGTYHYADRDGVGRDRTQKSGTGFTCQYSRRRFREYENLSACPDELLLFFHHVPYTHMLHSGKTVIQHIYDTHFCGIEMVREYQTQWESLCGLIKEEDFLNVKECLKQQYANAVSWRDQVNTYFFRKSGIPDEMGRTIYP